MKWLRRFLLWSCGSCGHVNWPIERRCWMCDTERALNTDSEGER